MEHRKLHDWPTDKFQAMDIQRDLSTQVEISDNISDIKYIAAVDTAYGKNAEIVFASAVVTTFPEIDEVEKTFQFDPVSFPYIPGMFYFREGETIIKTLEKLQTEPDLLIIHGHGIAHPKRCGTASMVGLAFDKPTIGCARKHLLGTYRDVDKAKGSIQPMSIANKQVGYVLRSKDGVKPIFISPGHKVDLEICREIIVKNLRGYRMPEPLRFAHQCANKFKRHIEKKHAQRK